MAKLCTLCAKFIHIHPASSNLLFILKRNGLVAELLLPLHRRLDASWRRFMKLINPKSLTLTVSLLLIILGASGQTAFADSYSWNQVFQTQKARFVAGDDFGNYTIDMTNYYGSSSDPYSRCGGVISDVCYETHYVGTAKPYFSTTIPTLWADSAPIAGTEDCSLYVGNRSVLCNNGHALYFGFVTRPDGKEIRGMFAGATPDYTDYIGNATFDGGFMTANGNAYFIDGINDTLDVMLNRSATPVPEPGSLLLLGTGGLAMLGAARRRAGL
jgi:hypothetical protein